MTLTPIKKPVEVAGMRVAPFAIDVLVAAMAPYNPRKITDEQASALGRSLDRFGLVEPIVLNMRTGTVVGGHRRIEALQGAGADAAPCVLIDVDETDERALNLALNKISGEWDFPKLSAMFKALPHEAWELTGFEEHEIAPLVAATFPAAGDDPGGAGEGDGDAGKVPLVLEADAAAVFREACAKLRKQRQSVETFGFDPATDSGCAGILASFFLGLPDD